MNTLGRAFAGASVDEWGYADCLYLKIVLTIWWNHIFIVYCVAFYLLILVTCNLLLEQILQHIIFPTLRFSTGILCVYIKHKNNVKRC